MRNEYSNFLKTKDGEKIFYSLNFKPEEKLDLPVLVFNYGLVCSNHHWSKQLGYFDKLGYPILIHDYRAHYQSSGKDNIEGLTFKNMASDLFEILNHLNITNTILLGHSMGVNVSIEFAVRYPELVQSMVLISGTVFPVNEVMFDTNIMEIVSPYYKYLIDNYPTTLDKFWKSCGINPLVHKMIHHGGFNTKTVSKEFIEIYINRLTQLGPEIFFKLLEQMSVHDGLSKLNLLKMPILIMGGDRDKVIPNHLQFSLHENLENSQLYVIRNGSHVPQADFPEFVNQRITSFLPSSVEEVI